MRRPQWLQFLASLGLEFWLPLPLLGLILWGTSGWIAERNLSRSSPTIRELQIPQNDRSPAEQVLSIKVTIDRNKGISQVRVKQATSVYQTQKFVVSTTQLDRVEAVIGEKLGLSADRVRQIVRYQIEN
jgi:hypothetical protein